jgi:hypothetical protein
MPSVQDDCYGLYQPGEEKTNLFIRPFVFSFVLCE